MQLYCTRYWKCRECRGEGMQAVRLQWNTCQTPVTLTQYPFNYMQDKCIQSHILVRVNHRDGRAFKTRIDIMMSTLAILLLLLIESLERKLFCDFDIYSTVCKLEFLSIDVLLWWQHSGFPSFINEVRHLEVTSLYTEQALLSCTDHSHSSCSL